MVLVLSLRLSVLSLLILLLVLVKVETGSGLPRTRAGKQARVMQMLQMGMLSPTKAYKYMDMADFKTLQAQFEADEEQADREHDKLRDGLILLI
jgi:integral membrane sensor domain MASE1